MPRGTAGQPTKGKRFRFLSSPDNARSPPLLVLRALFPRETTLLEANNETRRLRNEPPRTRTTKRVRVHTIV